MRFKSKDNFKSNSSKEAKLKESLKAKATKKNDKVAAYGYNVGYLGRLAASLRLKKGS